MISHIETLSPEVWKWLENPVWYALQTEQLSLRLGEGQACRYPGEYIPFAGLASREQSAFRALHALLGSGESIYITGQSSMEVAPAGFVMLEEIAGLQMIFGAKGESWPEDGELGEAVLGPLGPADVPDMLALKEAAFPGYYGPQAPQLGAYYGIRVGGALVAMAGERVALPGLREVSAVCTHPLHTGKGYAARLIARLVEEQLRAGLMPFLHLVADNRRALALYERLGFVQSGKLLFQHIRRLE